MYECEHIHDASYKMVGVMRDEDARHEDIHAKKTEKGSSILFSGTVDSATYDRVSVKHN